MGYMGRAGSFRTQDETEKRLGQLLSKEKRVTQEWYWRMSGERSWGKWTRDYFTQEFALLSLEIRSLQERGSADFLSPDEQKIAHRP